ALPISAGGQNFHDFRVGIFSGGALRDENRRLRAIAQSAELYTRRVESLEIENDELRKLMKLAEPIGKIKIPARIVHVAPRENRITINAGSKALVKPGLPVIAGEGLVGVVQTVDENTAQVLLLTSPPPFKIGAKVLRDPPAFGLLHGEAADRLSVEFMEANTPIEVDDWVVTSGFSEQIPPNIPIGRIVHREAAPASGIDPLTIDMALAAQQPGILKLHEARPTFGEMRKTQFILCPCRRKRFPSRPPSTVPACLS
ncbi:MAG: rod shape-determining protein MreC, partial [Proteobacteria bacterium]|nr:rod shape-determining protein MreC [Pseudomonadota bacterium]